MNTLETTNGTHAGTLNVNEPPTGKKTVTEAEALAGLKAAQDQARAANAFVDQCLTDQDKKKKAHHDAEAATRDAMDKAEAAEALVARWRAALRKAS